jgi:short-subunit dehydrogenase
MARDHLSAMVVTASGLGAIPVAGCTDYSAAKSFATFLMQGLNYELKGKIDCMAWQSGKVATKMNGDKADGSHCVEPRVAVKGMLRDLGRDDLTYGCAPHAKGMFMVMSVFPWSLLQPKFWEGFKKEQGIDPVTKKPKTQ